MVALPQCLTLLGPVRVPGAIFWGEDKPRVGGQPIPASSVVEVLPSLQKAHATLFLVISLHLLAAWFALQGNWLHAWICTVCLSFPSLFGLVLRMSHPVHLGLVQAGGHRLIPALPSPFTTPPLSTKSEPSHAYRAEPLTQKPEWGLLAFFPKRDCSALSQLP